MFSVVACKLLFSRRLSITSKWPAQSVQLSSKSFLRNMFSKVLSLILTNVLIELLARFLFFLYFGRTNKASFNCEMLTEQKETLTAVSLYFQLLVYFRYLNYYLKTFSHFVANRLVKVSLAWTEYLNITDFETSPDQCIHEGHRKFNSSI